MSKRSIKNNCWTTINGFSLTQMLVFIKFLLNHTIVYFSSVFKALSHDFPEKTKLIHSNNEAPKRQRERLLKRGNGGQG